MIPITRPHLRKACPQRILDIVEANGTLPAREISRLLGVNEATTSRWLRRLYDKGAIRVNHWAPTGNNGNFVAQWAASPGVDAPRPVYKRPKAVVVVKGSPVAKPVSEPALKPPPAPRRKVETKRLLVPDNALRSRFVGGVNPWAG